MLSCRSHLNETIAFCIRLRPTSARDRIPFKLVHWYTVSRPTKASLYASLLLSSISEASWRPGSDMLANIFSPTFAFPRHNLGELAASCPAARFAGRQRGQPGRGPRSPAVSPGVLLREFWWLAQHSNGGGVKVGPTLKLHCILKHLH